MEDYEMDTALQKIIAAVLVGVIVGLGMVVWLIS